MTEVVDGDVDGRWSGSTVRFVSSWTTGRAFAWRVLLSAVVVALFFWAIAVIRADDDDAPGVVALAALGVVVIALPYWIPLVLHRGITEVTLAGDHLRVQVAGRDLMDLPLSDVRSIRIQRTGAASRLTVRPMRGTRIVCSIGELYRTHRDKDGPIERIAPVPSDVLSLLEAAGFQVRSWRKRDANITLAAR